MHVCFDLVSYINYFTHCVRYLVVSDIKCGSAKIIFLVDSRCGCRCYVLLWE